MSEKDKSAEKTLMVEVRATLIETRSGLKAKRGDMITIPADEKNQTGAIRHALKSGGLKVINATTDLKPVTSEPAKPQKPQKPGEVRRFDDKKKIDEE